jgi:hypothetical protein
MNKKEYILKVLDALKDKRPIAKGLKILVDGNALNNQSIDSLIDIFARMAEETKDNEIKGKLEKSKNVLEKLQRIEQEQHLRDEKSLDELDSMIKEI